MSMEWLEKVSAQVASAAGASPASLAVSESEARALLEIARIAAHTSGARTNAPLLCYVLGLTGARGAALDELVGVVSEAAGETQPS